MRANLFAKQAHLLDILILKIFFCETTIGFDQASGKIGRSIAHDPFYIIQNSSYLLWSELGVIEERNKGVNSLLEVDVILPKCVICINQEVILHIESFPNNATCKFS